jgi:hypothetical protein
VHGRNATLAELVLLGLLLVDTLVHDLSVLVLPGISSCSDIHIS